MEGDTPRPLSSGLPETQSLLFPAADCEVIDTWTTTGLRATASNDWAVHDAFVPAAHRIQATVDRGSYASPLYTAGVFILSVEGAQALGVARHAIEATVELATQKTPLTMARRLADQPRVQAQMARVEALVGSARSYLFENTAEVWRCLVNGGDATPAQRARVSLAASHAVASSVEAIELMYRIGGGTSIYATSPLDRCLRDIHTAAAHVGVGPGQQEAAGRACLGMEPGIPWW